MATKKKKYDLLVLKQVGPDMRAMHEDAGKFLYPKKGLVEAPDWDPDPKRGCGGGLHGFAWGAGDASLASNNSDCIWLIIAADVKAGVVHSSGKCRFRRGRVVFSGTRHDAVAMLLENGAEPAKCNWSTLTGGNWSTLTGGYGSTLTGGDGSTLTGGYGSTLTGGDGSTLTGGNWSTLTGGNRSTLTGGDGSTVTGGNRSTLTGGYGSTLVCQWWAGDRYRTILADVGENGILPGVKYKVENGKFIPA